MDLSLILALIIFGTVSAGNVNRHPTHHVQAEDESEEIRGYNPSYSSADQNINLELLVMIRRMNDDLRNGNYGISYTAGLIL